MPEIQFAVPPGIYHSGTERESAGRWYASNLVRWLNGVLRPIYGWASLSTSAVSGLARALIAWTDNSANSWAGIGTHTNLYAMDKLGALYDITPTLNVAGRPDAALGTGYGGGNYGAGLYGTARPDSVNLLDATVWTLDTWGQDLVGCNADDGKPYEWNATVTLNPGYGQYLYGLGTYGTPRPLNVPAAPIANAPSGTALFVTAERFLVILGTSDPRTVQWSDQQNNTVWTPLATNQAGSFPLPTFGRLMCGKRLTGLSGIWTDTDFWTMTYIGGTLVYAFNKVASGCGIISRQAAVVTESQAAWMGTNGFFLYNGYVQPLPCDVQDYVFGNINRTQISKVTAVLNSDYGEAWWFYPSANSNEIDSAVSWSYRDNIWMLHSLARTCGADKSGAFPNPLMVNPSDNLVYKHETGFSYSGATPYAETGPFEFAPMMATYSGQGAKVWQANAFIPDELLEGDVTATFKSKVYPNGTETVSGPVTLKPQTDVRFTGRQVKMRITGAKFDDWRFGHARLRVNGAGDR